MSRGRKRAEPDQTDVGPPRRVRIPGFVPDEDTGLGDVVKRVTYTMGVRRPCGGCERRAAALNRRVVLARRPDRGQ
ncbi:hypothetical protein [Streptomyces sp. CB03911]|uniref:hypothetical protein n=1 Tax=Streptomyces sp. CB03911 TaxID=1804758 RepID=UPI00093B4A51|nr:hypothetical protein [Streptomyces sp. CB03911]OKI19504.1 hypothetical protein A6A07_08610 [Streptomyces sp. CB03911]